MKSRILFSKLMTATFCVSACATPQGKHSSEENGVSARGGNQSMESGKNQGSELNGVQKLLGAWQGPHGGLPPFSDIQVTDFKPAIESGIEAKRKDIAAIASSAEPANFENTIAALEDSGRSLSRVMSVYAIWSGTMSTPELQAVEKDMAPRLSAFNDEITQNEKLFDRIEKVYQTKKGLSPEQDRLTWKYYTDFVRAGAQLDAAKKKRLSAINQSLASLFTQFNQNLLADESSYVLIAKESDLAGLSASLKSSFAAAAEGKGHPGQWAVMNTRSSVEPFLTFAERGDLREKVWKAFTSRGDNGDAQDNNKIITQILQLRLERARLLGYKTHAHWRLEKSMAKTPERAMQLMETVWKPAAARTRQEIAEMLPLLTADSKASAKVIQPWDYRFYSEKVRKKKYDISEEETKPYFQLDSLREAMFWVSGELFDFDFVAAPNVPVVHPDVKVWEVKHKKTGDHIGLWYFDPYARAGKRSGAWMNAYRTQENFKAPVAPIVSNNSNFVKAAAGEPVLLSFSDASTLFHEFGHAVHGLASSVRYPSLAGTAVYRDYVEFPSQLMEDWLLTPEVLNRFALHYETKAPMPASLIEKIRKASTFNQGFGTVEYLSSAIVDMKYHLSDAKAIDPDAFERETLSKLGMPKEIVMRHRSPQFSHVFGSDGYSAGYYSYLWADTLSATAFEAFTEAKGPYDRAVADRLYENVLSVGNAKDPEEGFRKFRGRDPDTNALMRKRGFL